MDQKDDELVKNLLTQLDYNRWLLNTGITNEITKDNLFMFGSVAHKDVKFVEMDLVFKDKVIEYKLYCDTSLYKDINEFYRLRELYVSKNIGIYNLWKLKRLLKKHTKGSLKEKMNIIGYECPLDVKSIVNKMVKDYCGPKWSSKVTILNVKDYIDKPYEGQPGGNSENISIN